MRKVPVALLSVGVWDIPTVCGLGAGWWLGGTPASGVVQGTAIWWSPKESNLEAEIPQHFKVRTGHLTYRGTEMLGLGPAEVPQSQGYGWCLKKETPDCNIPEVSLKPPFGVMWVISVWH